MKYREISKDELKETLEKHEKWLNNGQGGERADLENADLRHADLENANLYSADLRRANLYSANLATCKGLKYSLCAFAEHGEIGRMLTCAIINNQKVYFCGCFRGSGEELREYIKEGEPELRESRMIAFEFVTKTVEYQKEQ